MVFHQDPGGPATRYLGDRLLARKAHALGKPGWEPVGGRGQLRFRAARGPWTLGVAPHGREADTPRVDLEVKVVCDFLVNRHPAAPCLPAAAEIREALATLWPEGREFMQCLDESGAR